MSAILPQPPACHAAAMTRPVRYGFGVVVAVLLLCGFDKSWKLYQHKVGNLAVMMPETPKEDSSVEKTAAGDITLWQASVIGTSKAYFISYSDMPKSTWKTADTDPKKMLEGARDGAAQ